MSTPGPASGAPTAEGGVAAVREGKPAASNTDRTRLAVAAVVLTVILFVSGVADGSGFALLVIPAMMLAGALVGGPLATVLKDVPGRLLPQLGADDELEPLRQERILLEERLEAENADENVLDNIRLTLNQLTEYYTINKAQARNSFRLSAIAIVMGLLTILAGAWLLYFDKAGVSLAVVTGVGGVIAEFIGAGFFYLSSRATKQLNFFYANLVRTQETMLAIHLVEQFDEKVSKDEARMRVMASLLSRAQPSAYLENGPSGIKL